MYLWNGFNYRMFHDRMEILYQTFILDNAIYLFSAKLQAVGSFIPVSTFSFFLAHAINVVFTTYLAYTISCIYQDTFQTLPHYCPVLHLAHSGI